MQCLRCGTPVPDGSRFCANCGSQLSDPGAATVRVDAAPTGDLLLQRLREALADEYEIEGELGRGGMAIVFKATELALGRPVALKVLPPDMAATPSIGERFKREARMAGSMSHPNIIDVYRVGQAGGIAYIAMRFVEGRALEDMIETQGALALPALLTVLRSAVSALAYAHGRGIIHRDIKPGNILIDVDGRVTVSDFGIARAVEEAGLTQSGAVIGTPYFMAPEQCAGLPLGPQCDQYAMGVVAFQMLTGSVPFKAESVIGIMHHHFSTPVPDVGTIRGGVPHALLEVVHRALAKRPEERYATTADMLAAVEAVPFSDADRREGEAILRRLARGARVSKVVTGEVTTPPPTYPGGWSSGGAAAASAASSGGAAAVSAPARVATAPLPAASATPSAFAATPAPPAAPPARAASSPVRRVLLALVIVALLVAGGAAVYHTRVGPAAQLRRAERLYAAGRHEAARGWFEKLARERPQMVEPHLYLARIARDRRDLATARAELDRALQIAPQHPLALREMGAALFLEGNYELARRFYVRAVQRAPDDPTAQGFLGCTLVRLGRVEEGRRFIARAGAGPWSDCAR